MQIIRWPHWPWWPTIVSLGTCLSISPACTRRLRGRHESNNHFVNVIDRMLNSRAIHILQGRPPQLSFAVLLWWCTYAYIQPCAISSSAATVRLLPLDVVRWCSKPLHFDALCILDRCVWLPSHANQHEPSCPIDVVFWVVSVNIVRTGCAHS
jgi:hypothetical protein